MLKTLIYRIQPPNYAVDSVITRDLLKVRRPVEFVICSTCVYLHAHIGFGQTHLTITLD